MTFKHAIAIGGLAALLNCATTNPQINHRRICTVGTASIDYFNNGKKYLCACGPAGYDTLGTDAAAVNARKLLKENGKDKEGMLLDTFENKTNVYAIVCVE